MIGFFWCIDGRFFSSNIAIIAPTMAIATMIPATAGTKYASAMDCGIGDGDAVACGALSTANAVTACDGQ